MGKIYIAGDINNIRVGMRQIDLSNKIAKNSDSTIDEKKNNLVVVYDTSGPYGDETFKTSFVVGLPRIRETWFNRRKDIVKKPSAGNSDKTSFQAKNKKNITQMYYAKKRVITPEMEYVAIRENQQIEALGLKSYITPDFVRKEIASGHAVIPANINHFELEPMIIGNRFFVKINSNIRLGDTFSKNDADKIRLNCCAGSDTIMDISNNLEHSFSREYMMRNCPVPVGTPPLYQTLMKVGGNIGDLSWEIYRDTLIEQLEQGVDFISVHAAMRRKYIKMTAHRLTGIVSYAGKILAQWMEKHHEENFLHVHFREICEIASSYDTVVSLGSSLRPGSVYDANDHAQFAELAEMRELIKTAWNQYVQVMVEAPGHIPMNKIEQYIKEFRYICKDVPLFSPGMLTSDISVGHENVSGAIGGAIMAWQGASVIGGLKYQADITDSARIKEEVLSYKVAAHAADLAKGHPGAQVRDNAFSKARQEKRLTDLENLSFDVSLEK